MPHQITYTIGDITTAIQWPTGPFDFDMPPAYQPFLSEQKIDLCLRLLTGAPEVESHITIFNSPPIWSLYRNGQTSVVEIFGMDSGLRRYLVLTSDVRKADLYFSDPNGQFMDPFFGPTVELLMINYLAQGHGIIMHACGIEYDGKGLLFSGESGAGKSTLANLWNQQTGATVLSDDRTLIREIDGEFRMYGTPWHGEAKFGAPRGIKLEQIYFLRHGPSNTIQSLLNTGAVLNLLRCSFPPHWEADGMNYTLEFFERLASRVFCSELEFRPDVSAIEHIKRDILQV